MKYSEANEARTRLSFLSFIAVAVLALSVTRGLVPILTHNGSLAQPTYHTATSLAILLSSYGLYVALFSQQHTIGRWPRRLLLINLFLCIYWLFPLVLLRPQFEVLVGFVYVGILPFSLYALMKVPEKALTLTLAVLTLVISGFVIYDFVALNTLLIPNGFDEVYQRQVLLRSDFEGLTGSGLDKSETGGIVIRRPSGLLGSNLPHDSGNLLAMFFVYWLATLFRAKGRAYVPACLTLVALVGLLLSQSASNIVAGFAGAFCVIAVNRKILYSRNGIAVVLVPLVIATAAAIGIGYFDIDLNLLSSWLGKVGTNADWEGMLNLGPDSFGANLFAILFGHGISLEFAPMRIVEYSFLKLVLDLGVLHALIFLALLFYPIILFFSKKYRPYGYTAAPYVAGIFVGFLSLWHYGSVLRSTNILVFFSLYAQALIVMGPRSANLVSAEPRKM